MNDDAPHGAPALSNVGAFSGESGATGAASTASSKLPGQAIDGAGRYRVLSSLGRGGMGEVVMAHDTLLGRQVAIKASLTGAQAFERLLAEAQLTASLEHAAIVPIYDAGYRVNGEPFYVMRVVRGRSLADAIRHTVDPPDRLALVRHVLEACRAVAFAHRLGVVHRDIKPANLLIGEFGETQVADWGLAATAEQAAAQAATIVGTPGFLAPEVLAGGVADARADVFSLGVTLAMVLGGRATSAGNGDGDGDGDRGRSDSDGGGSAGHGEDGDAPVFARGTPADLVAIVTRATAEDRSVRYGDAAELAADLEAFLSGRLVAAHDYSPLELARHFWVQFRGPIVVVTLALIAALLAIAVGWRSTALQRDRAEVAERVAHAAAQEAQLHLARLRLGQAELLALRGARAEAEVLATLSLRHEDSPAGRGVLADFAASAPPDRVDDAEFAGCTRPTLGRLGRAWACNDGAGVRWALGSAGSGGDDRGGRVTVARGLVGAAVAVALQERRRRVLVMPDYGRVDVHDGDDGRRLRSVVVEGGAGLLASEAQSAMVNARVSATVFDSDSGETDAVLRCPGGHSISAVALASAGDVAAAVCPAGGEGRGVAQWRRGRGMRFDAIAVTERGAAAADLDADGDTLVIAGLDGSLQAVDLASAATRSLGALRLRDVDGLVLGPGAAAQLVVHSGDGGGAVLRSGDGAVLAQIPGAGEVGLRLDHDGAVLALGARRQRWRLPTAARPVVLGAGAGVSAVASSIDGATLAVGRGTGILELWRLADGTLRASLAVCRGALKDIAFAPRGDAIAVMCTNQPGLWRASWPHLVVAPASHLHDGRRVGLLASGAVWAIDGVQALRIAPAGDTPAARVAGPGFADAATCAEGRVAIAVGGRDQIWRLDDGPAPSVRPIAAGAGAVAAACGRLRFAFADQDRITLGQLEPAAPALVTARAASRAPSGLAPRPIVTHAPRLLRLQLSRDDALLASAHLDGRVLLWRAVDGLLLATLRGHAQRVGSLAFASASVLVSGSWDGSARLWGLDPVRAPVDQLRHRWPIDAAAASATAARFLRP